MYVSNRMTSNPITITPKTSARKALDIMMSKGFSNIPVVDKGHMVGIIAKEDIINQYFCGEKGYTLMEDTLVEEIMTKQFITIRKMDYIEKAVGLLKDKDISALPVLDSDDNLVGIITRTDVFEAFSDVKPRKICVSRGWTAHLPLQRYQAVCVAALQIHQRGGSPLWYRPSCRAGACNRRGNPYDGGCGQREGRNRGEREGDD
jgi:CBS domain-containing protein